MNVFFLCDCFFMKLIHCRTFRQKKSFIKLDTDLAPLFMYLLPSEAQELRTSKAIRKVEPLGYTFYTATSQAKVGRFDHVWSPLSNFSIVTQVGCNNNVPFKFFSVPKLLKLTVAFGLDISFISLQLTLPAKIFCGQGTLVQWIERMTMEKEFVGAIPGHGKVALGLFSFFFLPPRVLPLSPIGLE